MLDQINIATTLAGVTSILCTTVNAKACCILTTVSVMHNWGLNPLCIFLSCFHAVQQTLSWICQVNVTSVLKNAPPSKYYGVTGGFSLMEEVKLANQTVGDRW